MHLATSRFRVHYFTASYKRWGIRISNGGFFFLHAALTDGPRELPIAVTSKQVRDVLKSELSTSVPVATPVVAVGASSNQFGSLPSKEGERHPHTPAEAAQSQEGPKTGDWMERNIVYLYFN